MNSSSSRRLRAMATAALLTSAISSAEASGIPVVAVGTDKSERSFEVDQSVLNQGFETVGKQISLQTLQVADSYENDQFQTLGLLSSGASTKDLSLFGPSGSNLLGDNTANSKTKWLLRNICVGLGVSFKMGFGSFFKLSATPRIRFGFSNSTHPKIPE